MSKNLSKRLYGFVSAAVCAAAVGLGGAPGDARADLILLGNSPATAFVDLGAQGFGNAPRLLTLQLGGTGASESGQLVIDSSGNVSTAAFGSPSRNDVTPPCCDGSKNAAPTLSSLGWTSGADVKLGMNTGEAGTDITLQSLVLHLYDASNNLLPTSFSIAGPIIFDAATLAMQQGNGNAIFEFVLTPAQQTTFNTAIGGIGNGGNFRIALAAQFNNVEDGPDSFLAVQGSGGVRPPTAVPEPGTLALLGLAFAGLAGLRRIKR
jgi:hypothetical protein